MATTENFARFSGSEWVNDSTILTSHMDTWPFLMPRGDPALRRMVATDEVTFDQDGSRGVVDLSDLSIVLNNFGEVCD